MKWAFETLAVGCFNAGQVYKMAKEKGLKCTKLLKLAAEAGAFNKD